MEIRIRRPGHRVVAAVTFLLMSLGFAATSFGQATDELTVLGLPQDPKFKFLVGNAWAIYLNGKIDLKAGVRLEEYVEQKDVPNNSFVFLNSPGGSLFGGMELGTVIRKHRFRTDVGIRKDDPSHIFSSDPGGCYSACTLAFMGGVFRFLQKGSHFGIHRFAFVSPQSNGMDVAQVASAAVVAYLRSMDIDTDLFTLSTAAGPDEIFEPSLDELKKLNVVTDGFNKPTWSIESNNGILYLKGERDRFTASTSLFFFVHHNHV